MFEGKDKLNFKLTKTKTFRNGKVFLCYEPIAGWPVSYFSSAGQLSTRVIVRGLVS